MRGKSQSVEIGDENVIILSVLLMIGDIRKGEINI